MENLLQFFSTYKQLFTIIHVFSVIVGMGGALISDILFNLYIQDKKINPTENKTLATLSKIIWISLGVIVLTGFFIFLSAPVQYAHSTKFLLKTIVVAVLIINGFLFWKITHKALHKINFTDMNIRHTYVRIRKLSFAFGAISIVSWITAFILGSIKAIPVSLTYALGIYVLILIGAIIGSQCVEYVLLRKKG